MPEVHVYLAEGRTDAQKRNLMAGVTAAVTESLGVPAEVVTVQIIEAKWTDKMKGGHTFVELNADPDATI